ncbi:MAG TPA: hypoxanthine phosphoribosyltransferase [Dehalococcoidales bacterium]|nr:hypoxanthine phosphoribosyltransferase [Dehalococcoidales bacterium]
MKPEIYISRRRINSAVKRVAQEISADYSGKKPLIIGILKGSFIFLADLARGLDFPLEMDFIRVSSYGNATETSGRVTLLLSPGIPVKGRHVLLVEDIIDSGLSIDFVAGLLQAEKPASLKICALLDKPSRRKTQTTVDYVGFTVPDKFLVGYGLDFAEQYRNLPDICSMEDK